MTPTVDILLPTYNGARYLAEQLDSLCRQTYTAFTLITRDDGSRDASAALVDGYADRLTIKRIPNQDGTNLGAVKSFELLMHESTADIVIFCDQDDVWEEARVERGVAALAEALRVHGPVPCAVFSDLALFSENDAKTTGSFLASTGCNPHALADPYYIAFRNPSPGCAMTINRALCDAARPFGTAVLMHDWWIMLTAALRGTIVFLDTPLLRYRLHASNTLGIVHDRPLTPLLSIISLVSLRKLRTVLSTIAPNIRQARAVFTKSGKRFSYVMFWTKFIAGRYLFPTLARYAPAVKKYSWKRST